MVWVYGGGVSEVSLSSFHFKRGWMEQRELVNLLESPKDLTGFEVDLRVPRSARLVRGRGEMDQIAEICPTLQRTCTCFGTVRMMSLYHFSFAMELGTSKWTSQRVLFCRVDVRELRLTQLAGKFPQLWPTMSRRTISKVNSSTTSLLAHHPGPRQRTGGRA
jgi:hypothetical protein